MSQSNNPFSIDRAEQLGDNLFEFYSNHKNFEGLLKSKSLMLEGGRGSGKTMFFLYHSYSSKKKESQSKGISFKDFFSSENLIGIHFRADSNFVPAFQHKGLDEEEWCQLFGHFLNITLSKRLVEIIIDINSSLNESDDEIAFYLSDELEVLLDSKVSIPNFHSLLKMLSNEEIRLMNYVNNINKNERPNVIGNGFLINLIAKSILKQDLFKDKSIHIFIDEYENMLLYQQRIVNTLIKHPNPVIIDVGMRNKGCKTYQTLADSEIITAPHDFSYYNFEQFKSQDYEELIVDICRKRLEKVVELKELDDDRFYDIRFYLGEYDFNDEVAGFIKSGNIATLKSKIKARIGAQKDVEILYSSDDPIILRLILVLFERGQKADYLASEYKLHLNNNESKFKDWLHNNKMGLVYLLCKENSKQKLYYGFNTYKSTSSGIIRFFLELCESAFKNAYRNSFEFNNPRALTPTEQSEAAYYVSQYKINDIETYTPYSNQLKRFVLLLGNIFEKFHRDPRLSEPEKNHFSSDFDKLGEETLTFLKSAELYSVLQKKEETKDKKPTIDSNNTEYHLNHIYAPYFQISPRKIRSLYIDPKTLDFLINSDSKKANEIANSMVKSLTKDDLNQIKIDLFNAL
ncbi:hypothetical protein [Flavobacterium sp. WC2430]|uniref:ORC-CDC6 family AAA ATPase n=1 Tax=Flavobacterium sp. WC2430 TaxID=3234137 RepID=UPI003466FEB6